MTERCILHRRLWITMKMCRVEGRIEQGPGFRGLQRQWSKTGRELAVIQVGARGVLELTAVSLALDSVKSLHQSGDRRTSQHKCPGFIGACGTRWVRVMVGQISELRTDALYGQPDHCNIMRGNCGVQHACKLVELREHIRAREVVRRPRTIANRGKVGEKVGAILRRQPQVEHTIEVVDHFSVGVETSIMKI